MTYNVFGGTLNLTQPTNQSERRSTDVRSNIFLYYRV